MIALALPTTVAQLLDYFDEVAQVSDVGEIVRGIPLPALPNLRLLSLSLAAGAVAVAVIVLVQGAGVAESTPNPDGSRSDSNSDFMSQGWANVASGFFRGIPVGGSVSQTALGVSVGAKTRWTSIMSGVWILVVLALLSTLAGSVAIPTLAAILIVASIGSIRPTEITTVWKSGAQSQIAMTTTFVSTLFLPISGAVGIGVALSLLLSVNQEAQDVRLVHLEEDEEGRFIVKPPPATLESRSVTLLDVYAASSTPGRGHWKSPYPALPAPRTRW